MDSGGGNANACATLPSFGSVTNIGAANSIALAVGDIDGDGKKDAVVVTRTSSSGDVLIYPGITGGGFSSAAHSLHSGTPTLATGVVIADVNADGSNDIVTWEGPSPVAGSQGTFGVSVHRQNMVPNQGTFATAQTFSVANLEGVIAGNLNNDGYTDLVIQSGTPATGMDETFPYLASAATPGTFTKGTIISSTPKSSRTTPSHVIDVDGDGFDDVVFTRMTGGLGIYFNSGTATFTTTITVGSGSSENAVFGHFKSATRMDLFLWGSGTSSPGHGELFEQTAARAFTERTSVVIDNIHVDSVHVPGDGLPTVDINADGRDDVVGTDQAEIQCPTAGTFWPTDSAHTEIRFGDQLTPSVVRQFTDINGGGSKPDLIALDAFPGSSGNTLEVWLQ